MLHVHVHVHVACTCSMPQALAKCERLFSFECNQWCWTNWWQVGLNYDRNASRGLEGQMTIDPPPLSLSLSLSSYILPHFTTILTRRIALPSNSLSLPLLSYKLMARIIIMIKTWNISRRNKQMKVISTELTLSMFANSTVDEPVPSNSKPRAHTAHNYSCSRTADTRWDPELIEKI